MRPLLVEFLKRVAVYGFVLAAVLAPLPRVLREFGIIGPTPAEETAEAARALEAARAYGAAGDSRDVLAARAALEEARRRMRLGERRRALKAALEARSLAIRAQEAAVASREEDRRQAKGIVTDVDARINELEDLYDEAAVGKDKKTVAMMLSLMKVARQEGARLLLAYEEGDYSRVIVDERAVIDVLASAREELKRQRPSP